MAVPKKVIKFIEEKKIKYEIINHRQVFTAYDKAQTLKVHLKIIGKTLAVKLDRDFVLVLIPANRNLDKEKLKKTANVLRKKAGQKSVKTVDFAKESWMKKNLKGIKIGATPPLGKLWKRQTFVDSSLLKEPKIFLNSGDYEFSLKISGANLRKIIPDSVAGNFGKAKK